MIDYHLTVVAPLSRQEPLAYSMAPRTVPTLVRRFTNPRPPVQNGTTPNERRILASPEQLSGGDTLRRARNDSGDTEPAGLRPPAEWS